VQVLLPKRQVESVRNALANENARKESSIGNDIRASFKLRSRTNHDISISIPTNPLPSVSSTSYNPSSTATMGITDFLSSAMEYLNITEVAHAEAPEKDEEESKDEGGDDKEEKDGGDDEEEKDGGDDEEKEEGGDDEEEEEEEEEEPVDPKPALEEGKSFSIQRLSLSFPQSRSTKALHHVVSTR
jgi:hypothetical protein